MAAKIEIDDVTKASQSSSMGLCLMTCLLMAAALFAIFWYRPIESTAVLAQRMVYVYVPAMWVAGVAFVLLMLTSAGYLFTSRAVWQSRASAMAEVGMLFCSVTLVVGVLRGKAVTGHWLNIDIALAMMVVVWALLLVYLSLRHYAATRTARKWLAALSVLMCFSVPAAYSGLARIVPTRTVEMMAQQYAGSEFDLLLTLMTSMLAFLFLFWYLVQHRVSLDVMETELEQLRQTILAQPWQANHLLIENRNFVIEGYSLMENHQYE